ncbi:probable inactive poly [ADP-ribose] polymerase SRO3 [Solanum lycopersicum]|uniref:probable inactive poly [ADP-ribose] polymerase SRO3 n=1 Tax=Solanum lycopersicum TaxID=4081 RepID=UPI003748DB1F
MIGSSNNVDESQNLSLDSSNESGSSSRIVMATPNELVPPKWAGTKLLSEEGRIYQKIKDGLPPIMKNRVTITAIHLCMRRVPVEESRFEVYLENVKKVTRARGRRVDSSGWYGTSAKNVDSLMRRGFEMNSIMPASYPHGVDENGEKHIVLCQFILGNSEKVELGSKQLFPSSANFDTGVDELTNPKVYVVWCGVAI